jgi:hypothetical protein
MLLFFSQIYFARDNYYVGWLASIPPHRLDQIANGIYQHEVVIHEQHFVDLLHPDIISTRKLWKIFE